MGFPGSVRRRRSVLLTGLVAALALLACAAPAQAERFAFAAGYDVFHNGDTCIVDCQPARGGLEAAQLGFPIGAAVIGDRVFVPELLANRVSVHDLGSGEFLFAFGKDVGGLGTSTCTRDTGCTIGAVLACPNGEPPPFGCAPNELIIPGDTVLQPASILAVGDQLFIAESSHRVSVWEPDGDFVRAFGRGVGGPGVDSCVLATPCLRINGGENDAGELWAPGSVAVSGGEAFVADANRRVSVFDATTGSYKRAYGKDVGGAGIHVCTDPCAPGAEGGGGSSGPLDFAGSLAAADGELYVADLEHLRIAVHDAASGAFVRAISSSAGDGAGQLQAPVGVTLADGELFVPDAVNLRVSVFDAPTGTFRRAVGRNVGGAGVNVCTTSCQAGALDGDGAVTYPALAGVGGGRLVVPSALGGSLTALDAHTGSFAWTAGSSVRTGGGNEFELCRDVCQAGRFGTAGGHLGGPGQVALAGGELFVADRGTSRVSVFDAATGLFARAFGRDVGGPGVHTCTTDCRIGTPGDDAGELLGPSGVAVAGGEVFVSDGNNRVSVFDAATGAFARALGKDVGGPGVRVCTTTCQAGATGTGAGELDSPVNVAAAGGHVFVVDQGNDRVSVLDAVTGAFVRSFGGGVGGTGANVCTSSCQAGNEGQGAGELREPLGVAVSGGEVFVSENLNHRVSIFDAATGAFLRAYGLDVGGPGAGVCTTACVRGNASLGLGSGAGGILNPYGVTVFAGELYVADGRNNRISVFDAATGAFVRAFGKGVGGTGVDTCTTTCRGGRGDVEETDDPIVLNVGDGVRQIPLPFGVAASATAVFVADQINNRIAAFSRSSDGAAPDTEITSGPTGVVKDDTPAFGFQASEGGAAFECRVDTGSFRPCTSEHTTAALADGPHTFEVRAIDAAWNFDATAASRNFVVDVHPPQTTITSGPVGPDGDLSPTYGFASSEAGSTFECRVDGAAFAPCTSPHTVPTARRGEHTFAVRATDAAGNTDQSPATRSFGIDTTPPTATITSGPSGVDTNDATPTFTFTSSEDGSTFECRIDFAVAVACTSPWTSGALAEGRHSFEVRAIDRAGNVSEPLRTQFFRVDTIAPQTTITFGPSGSTFDSTPHLRFSSSEPGTFECRIDGGAFTACSTPHDTETLSPGSHTFAVRAVDQAGTPDPTPATRTFTVR